ncbi:MAG: TIGR03960 family B12-binding radical SAM protein [Syntrophomonadaceae bacterium]
MKDKLFRDILPRVAKPIRYVGGELNAVRKDWGQSQVKMALAFPDVYEIGMAHIGSKILYGLVNEKSPHLLERAFAPWPDMEQIMRQEGVELYSLESFTPLRRFDVIGFSLQYELSITNVLNMLDLAGIPLLSSQRGEEHPLIIGGGPVAFNPEPFADFFDALLIGEGEELLLEFLSCLYDSRGLGRQERLTRSAAIEGVYVPSGYRVDYKTDGSLSGMEPISAAYPARVRKRLLGDLDTAYYPDKPIVPYMEIVHDRAVLEVMRGCQRACRFCHAGTVYRPVRERSAAVLKNQAESQLKNTGYDEISLASLSTLDYSGIAGLVKDLVRTYGDRGIGVSLPSLRVDAFSIDLANEVQKVRKTTLTLAPEAGTQRLRDVINKNVTDEDLFRAVEAAFSSGWNAVKLYFMLGLPTETEADLDGLLDLLARVRAIGQRHSRRPVEIRASLACFVPKAHTPFQWRAQNTIAELEAKRRYLTSRKIKNVKMSFHDSRTSMLEGVVARGDRRLNQVILAAWQKGCKFDGWSEHFDFDRWMEAFRESAVDPEFYVYRRRDYGELFPWDFIDTGVYKDYLRQEDQLADAAMTTADCRQAGCLDCGICVDFGVSLDVKEGNADATAG